MVALQDKGFTCTLDSMTANLALCYRAKDSLLLQKEYNSTCTSESMTANVALCYRTKDSLPLMKKCHRKPDTVHDDTDARRKGTTKQKQRAALLLKTNRVKMKAKEDAVTKPEGCKLKLAQS